MELQKRIDEANRKMKADDEEVQRAEDLVLKIAEDKKTEQANKETAAKDKEAR